MFPVNIERYDISVRGMEKVALKCILGINC